MRGRDAGGGSARPECLFVLFYLVLVASDPNETAEARDAVLTFAVGAEEGVLCVVVAFEAVEEGEEDMVWRVRERVLEMESGEVGEREERRARAGRGGQRGDVIVWVREPVRGRVVVGHRACRRRRGRRQEELVAVVAVVALVVAVVAFVVAVVVFVCVRTVTLILVLYHSIGRSEPVAYRA